MANNYPIWWNDTITIFNKYTTNTNEVIWYKHKVTGAFWKNTGEKVVIGSTVLDSSTTVCRIRKDTNFVDTVTWKGLTNEQKCVKFTLAPGDIIVLGDTTDTIDEYTSGIRSSDILASHREGNGAMLVEKLRINAGDGLGQEHYYVKGT